jgi:hypothetical protein
MGEPLTDDEQEVFRRYTGNRAPPTEPIREAAFVVGRRGGKDRAISVLAAYLATCCDWPMLTKGERGTLLIIAPDREQAAIQFNYIAGALESSPLLSQRITAPTSESIALDNGITIEVRAANYRRIRGLTCIAAICSESAFWMNENSANPDTEILRAVRPSLLTTSGMLCQISTPYARQGELWNAFSRHFGKDGDVLVVNGTSRDFNPTLPEADIARAYQDDPEAAAAEYGGEFRNDLSSYIDRAAVMACVNGNVREIGPRGGRYHAFVDPSGGRGDSMCMAIAHEEDDDRIVIDVISERIPPFSPDDVVAEFASTLRRYSVSSVTGDRYGAEWTAEAFRKVGIRYENSELPSSDLFRELVPLLNTRGILLLENQRAIGQLCALQRRVGRSGRDTIEHPRGGHDDLAVSIAGVAWLAGTNAHRRGEARLGFIDHNGVIHWQGEARVLREQLEQKWLAANPGRPMPPPRRSTGYLI